MAKKMNETIGKVDFETLIVDACPPADVVAVTLAKGTYKRGTVVTGTVGGELAAATGALTAENATYILCDDVTLDSAGVAFAYRTGHFNGKALITNGVYKLVAADKELLRKSGILISDAMDY